MRRLPALLPLLLLLALPGCPARQVHEAESHPYRDVNQVAQEVYRTFPEIPPSHVFVTYDLMGLGNRRQLWVQDLRFYVPRARIEEKGFQQLFASRARDLFLRLGNPNPECVSVVTGRHDVFFSGVDGALREVRLETACG